MVSMTSASRCSPLLSTNLYLSLSWSVAKHIPSTWQLDHHPNRMRKPFQVLSFTNPASPLLFAAILYLSQLPFQKVVLPSFLGQWKRECHVRLSYVNYHYPPQHKHVFSCHVQESINSFISKHSSNLAKNLKRRREEYAAHVEGIIKEWTVTENPRAIPFLKLQDIHAAIK